MTAALDMWPLEYRPFIATVIEDDTRWGVFGDWLQENDWSRETLWKLVLQFPDNSEPRLLMAQWLEEHGDPLGEFVRVQVELARMPQGEPVVSGDGWDRAKPLVPPELMRKIRLQQRQAVLLAEHEQLWLSRYPEVVRRCRGIKCNSISPIHGDACNGGRVAAPNAQFTKDCLACHGTGRTGGWDRGFVGAVSCTAAVWCGGNCEYCHSPMAPNTWTPCRRCGDLGRIPGIAAEVCRSAPISHYGVTLTDKRPMLSHWSEWPSKELHEFTWWKDSETSRSHDQLALDAALPDDIYAELDLPEIITATGLHFKHALTESAALRALSAAAVSLGRAALLAPSAVTTAR